MRAIICLSTVLLITFTILSCETTEKIDNFPLRPSKLVVNSFFSPDSTWELQVSKSLSVLDNADLQLVNNASINIYRNKELIDTLRGPVTDGWYRSDLYPPIAGDNYSIEVTTPEYQNVVYAQDDAPEPVPISNVTFTLIDSNFHLSHHQVIINDEYFSPRYGRMEGTFNITINDPPDVENYYQLFLHGYNEYFNSEDSTLLHRERRLQSFKTDDPVADDDSYRISLLFSDELFDGQVYKLKLSIMDWDATPDKEYAVELMSFNRTGYLYRRSVDDYQNSRFDPFSEPVLVYSNIENGYGIFAGYAISTYPYRLDLY